MRKTSNPDLYRVQHMLSAVTEALKFISGHQQKDIFENRLLALALVKEIEMLGEAASKVSKPFQKRHPDIPWSKIIATRNRLIHGYFDVDYEMVWKIVKINFLPLKSKLTKVITSVPERAYPKA